MALTAKISAAELRKQVSDRFVGRFIEAALINQSGVTYQPGSTNDSTFLGFEVTEGTAGYRRQIFSYSTSDLTQYTDDGVALNRKATVFEHDGGTNSLDFTHVALLDGNGNVATLDPATSEPTAGANGVYRNLPTSTTGDGTGLTIDLTVNNNVFRYEVGNPGYGYSDSDTVTILEANLVTAGVISTGGGACVVPLGRVQTSTNGIIAVAQTANPVVLTAGNQAAFYWNLKQFGYFA